MHTKDWDVIMTKNDYLVSEAAKEWFLLLARDDLNNNLPDLALPVLDFNNQGLFLLTIRTAMYWM